MTLLLVGASQAAVCFGAVLVITEGRADLGVGGSLVVLQ